MIAKLPHPRQQNEHLGERSHGAWLCNGGAMSRSQTQATVTSAADAACADDRGGGVRQAGENLGAAAAVWDPVASRLAAWARGDRLAPFDGGRFAARLEAPPSSLSERGGHRSEGDGGDEKKKEKERSKKKEKGEQSFSSSASASPSLSLWDGLRTSPVLLASGARLVRLPAVNSSSGGTLPLRGLWRALRLHPRARWIVVSDSFPPQGSGGGGEAALAMEGELPPGVALAVRKR